MITDLPFSKEAEELGYTLHHHGGDGNYACYIKDGVFLDVWESGKAKLTITNGLIQAFIEFSLPNKNFDIFERKIQAWWDAVREL